MSDSPGLVDFAIALVNSVSNFPDGQMNFFEEFKLQKNCEINLLIKTFFGLVEMIFGLVNVGFSLPEWQAVNKNDFLCTLYPHCFPLENQYSQHLSLLDPVVLMDSSLETLLVGLTLSWTIYIASYPRGIGAVILAFIDNELSQP